MNVFRLSLLGLPLLAASSAIAQEAAKPDASIPDIVVVTKKQPPKAAKAPVKKAPTAKATPKPQTQPTASAIAEPVAPDPSLPPMESAAEQSQREAYGAVDGIVAKQTGVGTKTATPITAVPQTVNVVSRDELDMRAAQDFNTAVGYTPGVRIIDYPGGQGGPDVFIRGFRQINYQGIFSDGLRAGFNSFDKDLEMFGVERIDIVKGPASVVYGQSPPGGLVNLISKRPTETPLNRVSLQVGSFDRVQGEFDFSGPVAGNKSVLYRFNGLVRESDTQVALTPDDRVYLAPSLTLKPSDDTTLTLLGSYLDVRRGGSEQNLPIYGTLYPNPNGKIPRNLFIGDPDFNKEELTSTSVGYDLTHRFNDAVRFHSVSRYTKTSTDYDNVQSEGFFFDRFILRYAQDRSQNSESFQTDNNVEVTFDTGHLRHQMLAGVDYAHYKRKDRRANGDYDPFDVFDPVYSPVAIWYDPETDPFALTVNHDETLSQLGFYVQDQIRMDRWVLTAGIRHDRADTSDERIFIPEGSPPPYPRTLGGTDTAVTWRGGLAYEFDSGVTPYVSYATSFVPQTGPKIGGGTLDPTEGEQYEVGIKYQPTGTNSLYQISAFDITQTNLPVAAAAGFFDQLGEVRTRGIEIEGKSEITRNLDVIASYAYLDAIVTKDDTVAPLPSREGNRQEAVPRHAASLWLNYTFHDGMLRGLQAGAGVRYMGSVFDSYNVNEFPDYALVDAAVSYNFGAQFPELRGTRLTISGTNIFDEEYYTPGFLQDKVKVGYERSILAKVTYEW